MRFLVGLLLGMIVGIGVTTAFLVAAGGGDYLISVSPRVRELETSLKIASTDRESLRKRLGEADEAMARLESRFSALASRFEVLSGAALSGSAPGNSPESQQARGAGTAVAAGAAASMGLAPTTSRTPVATAGHASPSPARSDDDAPGAADTHH